MYRENIMRNHTLLLASFFLFVNVFSLQFVHADPATPTLSDEAPEIKIDDPWAHDEDFKEGEWQSTASLGFNMTDGNSNTTLFTAGLSSEMEKGKNIWRFKGEHSFGEDDNETNLDQSEALAEYKRLITERMYYGLGTKYTRDDIADLKYRVWINPVLGYFLYKNKDVKFNIEGGPSYVFEEQGDDTNDYFAPRFGERLSYAVSKTASILHEAYVTLDTTDSDNYIIEARLGLSTTVTETISLVITIEDIYDNVPAEGRVRNDLGMFSTLSLAF